QDVERVLGLHGLADAVRIAGNSGRVVAGFGGDHRLARCRQLCLGIQPLQCSAVVGDAVPPRRKPGVVSGSVVGVCIAIVGIGGQIAGGAVVGDLAEA